MIEGKTVLMVTHRKALLALMDTIYVLDNSQLTNVNELGGLDNYLAKLEGLELEIAQKKDIDAPGLSASSHNPEITIDATKPDQENAAEVINNEPLINYGSPNTSSATKSEENDGTLFIPHNK